MSKNKELAFKTRTSLRVGDKVRYSKAATYPQWVPNRFTVAEIDGGRIYYRSLSKPAERPGDSFPPDSEFLVETKRARRWEGK